jgi:hypothetical protein
MSRQYTLVTYDGASTPSTASAQSAAREGRDLHQELPPPFARMRAGFLRANEEPLASLFVDRDETPEEQTPARALVLSAEGVLFLEEGEARIGDSRWGVRSLFYPYARISAVGMGEALLTARFTLHGAGNAPPCEIPLPARDRERFAAAARLIAEKAAVAGGDV